MKKFFYMIGNGWSGVFEIEAESVGLAVRRIKQMRGIDRVKVHIWEEVG